MLTLYYIGATFWQSWRIKSICTKINEQLSQKASVTFYALSATTDDGYDPALATSELCINRESATVSEILWLNGNQRGCCLLPMQLLHIKPWISFPELPGKNLLPFSYSQTSEKVLEELAANDRHSRMILLMETDIKPCYENGLQADVVRIEEYAVNYEGKPQPFELVSSHLRKPSRTSAAVLIGEPWRKHLEDLHSLSILASQATEFEYNKNRTEGKTGVVKPDLIPSEKKAAELSSSAETTDDKKDKEASAEAKEISAKLETEKAIKESPKMTPEKASTPNKVESTIKPEKPSTSTAANSSSKINKVKVKPTEIKKPGSGRFTTTKVSESAPKASVKSQPSTKHNETTSSATSATSQAPTTKENKTTTTAQDAAKVSATQTAAKASMSSIKTSPAKTSPAKSSPAKTTASELERIAAASVAQKHHSPLHTAGSSTSTASTATASELKKTIATPEKVAIEKPTSTYASKSEVDANASTASASSISTNKDNAQRPSLRRNKDSLRESKPLNILIYSDSASAKESALITLKEIIQKDTYTIYSMTPQQVEQKHWLENTALLVVCGSVAPQLGEIFVDYFLRGGKVLSLCSDILHFILPTYRTAEVREHELVQFSYDKWQKVKMMHHIFCYQPSPVKKNFSTDSEDSGKALSKKPSIELKDLLGEQHNLDVKVLGTEETWNTPSLLLANSVKSGGKAVFSQVHLETNPNQFEADELKLSVLKLNEKNRLEIFADLLQKYLNVSIQTSSQVTTESKCIYKNAFFLGRHESKNELLQKLKERTDTDNVITTSKLTMKFCGKDDKLPNANTNVLPILIHSCPDDFSTVEYFDNLKTEYIGRLVIYTPVVNSSMNVINELELTNGIAVLPREQTDGSGRSNNQWLSPLGCAMFSLQLHVSLDSALGSRLPLMQHIVSAAIVNCLKTHDTYKDLDIGLKWPNDIYANGIHKIGGLIIKTTIYGKLAVVNIGSGINLDNSKPTVCINDLIAELNRLKGLKIPPLKYENFIALIFNEIERLVEEVQKTGNFEKFYQLYYRLWLHNDQTVTICEQDGKKRDAQIIGLDEYGYLKVKLCSGSIESVQPDGNSFDMLKGLIIPKFN